MRVLVVDDENSILEEAREMLHSIDPSMEIVRQNNSRKAFELFRQESFDLAILDIEMPGMNGLMLAKEMKLYNPRINLIFVTAYSRYAVDAFSLYASGYLLKPLKQDKLKEALENLRFSPDQMETAIKSHTNEKKQGFYVRCFGTFEVYYNGMRVEFERNRAKEILAYLIDKKGEAADTEEICLVLWEDSQKAFDNHHYFRNLMSQLKKTLKDYHVQDILVISRNQFAVDPDKINCDYYSFLKGEAPGIQAYHGEYMMQYSWAEMTMASLTQD